MRGQKRCGEPVTECMIACWLGFLPRPLIALILMCLIASASLGGFEQQGQPSDTSPGGGYGKNKANVARFKIGICDWMVLKRQKIGVFTLARELGADGVEVDIGPLGNRVTFDNRLTNELACDAFLKAARTNGVEICSIAMTAFYAVSFAERTNYIDLVCDTIDTMKRLGVRVGFLPLGVASDLQKRPELRPELVNRLRRVGRMAAEAGVVIGIETTMPASDEVALLEEIGSPAIKIYFNLANAVKFNRDPCKEIRILGKDLICQIHCSNEDGELLENDRAVDLVQFKAALDEIGWSGWLVIERSRDRRKPRDIQYNFGSNIKYLRSIFQPTISTLKSVGGELSVWRNSCYTVEQYCLD